MKKISLEFEDIIGRYFNLKVKKHNYRISKNNDIYR